MQPLLTTAVTLFDTPYDDRDGDRPASLPSLRFVAEEMGTTILRVRKLLITAEYFTTSTSRHIQMLIDSGCSVEAVIEQTGLRRASVYSYIPYKGLVFNLEETTLRANHSLMATIAANNKLEEYFDTSTTHLVLVDSGISQKGLHLSKVSDDLVLAEMIINDTAAVDVEMILRKRPVKRIRYAASHFIRYSGTVTAFSVFHKADDLLVVSCSQDAVPGAEVTGVDLFPEHGTYAFGRHCRRERIREAVSQFQRASILVFPADLHISAEKGFVFHQDLFIQTFRLFLQNRAFPIGFVDLVFRLSLDAGYLIRQFHASYKEGTHLSVDLIDLPTDPVQR